MKEIFEALEPWGFVAEDDRDRFPVIELGTFGETGAWSLVALSQGSHPQHGHAAANNVFFFFAGEGYVILGEKMEKIFFSRGTRMEVPAGTLHGFEVEQAGGFLVWQSTPITDPATGGRDVFYPKD